MEFSEFPKIEQPKHSESTNEMQVIKSYLEKANCNLGHGTLAESVLTREEDTFCVKVFNPARTKFFSREILENEFLIHEEASTSGIKVPKLLGHYFNEETHEYFIYMEKIKGFSLEDYREKRVRFPKEFNLVTFWQKVEKELGSLHQKGTIHNDISLGNIMVEIDTDDAVLIDFGLSRKFPVTSEKDTLFFTKKDREDLDQVKLDFSEWYEDQARFVK